MKLLPTILLLAIIILKQEAGCLHVKIRDPFYIIPNPVKKIAQKTTKKKEDKVELIGIVHSAGKNGALIDLNGERLSVTVGDYLGIYKICDITDDSVLLAHGKQKRRLEISL